MAKAGPYSALTEWDRAIAALDSGHWPESVSEKSGYWFFRLNGCFTITNFILHPLVRGGQLTDADILAVRFPDHAELDNSPKPLEDEPVFLSTGRIDFMIGEMKAGLCALNGPWTRRSAGNVDYVLRTFGAFPDPEQRRVVADSLYDHALFDDGAFRVRLFALGERRNVDLPPAAVQVTWADVATFVHRRFSRHHAQKTQHDQWDGFGRVLFRLAGECGEGEFVNRLTEWIAIDAATKAGLH